MDRPIVTVILANRNYGQYIEGAIRSVLQQTYKPIQLVIVDDASTDNSLEVISDFEKSSQLSSNQKLGDITVSSGMFANNRFLSIKLPQNVGPSEARNIAVKLTWNETWAYAILDADDEFYPNKIEKCVNKLLSFPELGVVYGDYHILNMETGNLIYEYKWPYSRQKILQESIIHSGFVAKKDIFAKVMEDGNIYCPHLTTAEDFDLCLRMTEHGMAAHIPEALTMVRNHNQNSVNYRSNETWQKNWQLVVQRAKQRNKQ